MAGPTTKSTRRKPKQAKQVEDVELPEEEKRTFATKASLGDKRGYEEIQLPVLQEWVKARYLSTAEIARLQFLPDLVGSAELLGKSDLKDFQENDPEENPQAAGDFVIATIEYLAGVVHLSVLDPGESTAPRKCSDCTIKHPPSLWTRSQCALLKQPDMEKVAEIALQTDRMRMMGPFSEEQTQADSDTPVNTGESTQQTN